MLSIDQTAIHYSGTSRSILADRIAINVKVIDSEVGPRLRAVRDQIKGAFAAAERSAKNLGQTNAQKCQTSATG